MRKTFKAGEILFSEGDPSDHVLRIASGTVQVRRALDGESILLGTVGAGEFLGEMGVLEDEPRSATASAVTEVEAEIWPGLEFLQRMSSEPSTAYDLLLRLSARLRDVSDQLMASMRGEPVVPREALKPSQHTGGEAPSLTIKAGTPGLAALIGPAPQPVQALPCLVGRGLGEQERGLAIPLDLTVPETPPYRLAHAHFIILVEHDTPVVRDLATPLGTIVNGRNIGREFAADVEPLKPGDNEVIAGGADSPHRFTVTVG
jgi:hypothetical protein